MGKLDLQGLLKEAAADNRKRKTFSPKPTNYPGCRYMVNALMPGTYIPPHRHNEEGSNELWYVLQGEIIPVFFSEEGDIAYSFRLRASDEVPLIEIPERIFHTLIVPRIPSVILEVSKGPYNPETYKEFASWAPQEKEEARAEDFLNEISRRVSFLPESIL